MKKLGAILGGAVILAVVAFSTGAQVVGTNSEADEDLLAPFSADSSQDFSLSEMPPTPGGAIAAAATHTVYFFPQDTDTTTTVIFMANTNMTSSATIYRYYYRSDGSLYNSGGTIIPPGDATMRASDDTTSGNVVWNFTATTKYVKLVLPDTVALDGYVAYKGLSSKYDYNLSTNMRPVRFITVP